MKTKLAAAVCLVLGASLLLGGCGKEDQKNGETQGQEKIFRYGTTAYGVEMGNTGLNPHDNYSGWSCVRYGVGETLFRFTENMELEPWLAKSYEQIDEHTVKITLKEQIRFSSGRPLDGNAVKECLEDLVSVHDRAPGDLKIQEIQAEGQTVTIFSEEKVPALLNYLSDPYGAIIDMEYGVTEDKNVAGTGPFIAKSVSDTEISLEKNPDYWGGEVQMDQVQVKEIIDGDTLTMAMQAGELDAVQGLPYASLPLFQGDDRYKISTADTSRTFFAQLNYETEAFQDQRVREAVARGIDRDSFTQGLLNGNGTPAKGPFPASFTFGDDKINVLEYDPQEAKRLLKEAGWEDTDKDGYVDKNGENLTIRWLTYPGRQELPLLAESAQADLKAVGIKVEVNNTANQQDFLDKGEWDIYASAFVTAPTGDPEYFFTTYCLKESAKNRGKYYSEELEELETRLHNEFDREKRGELAVQMQQKLIDDGGFIFASHLKMSFVMKSQVAGFEAHPSDYYEITKDLRYE